MGLSVTVPNRVRQSVNKSFYAVAVVLFFVNLTKGKGQAMGFGHQPGPNNRVFRGLILGEAVLKPQPCGRRRSSQGFGRKQ